MLACFQTRPENPKLIQERPRHSLKVIVCCGVIYLQGFFNAIGDAFNVNADIYWQAIREIRLSKLKKVPQKIQS